MTGEQFVPLAEIVEGIIILGGFLAFKHRNRQANKKYILLPVSLNYVNTSK